MVRRNDIVRRSDSKFSDRSIRVSKQCKPSSVRLYSRLQEFTQGLTL